MMKVKDTDHSLQAILVALGAALLLLACGGSEEPAQSAAPPTPPDAIQTLMLTYETVISPDEKSARFQVASDGTFVRLGNETEQWRLFDTRNKTITFVDQTAGTATVVSYDQAVADRKEMLAGAAPEGSPSATVVDGPGEPERGHPTRRIRIDVGNFSRELVLSEEKLLPEGFFAMKVVTDPVDPRYASIMRDVLPTLLRQTGTLLSETNRLQVSEDEAITATTKLQSVTTVQLSQRAFQVPDNITVTMQETEPEATPPSAAEE